MEKSIIELDDYINLTDLDIVNKEFLDSIDKVPVECISEFHAYQHALNTPDNIGRGSGVTRNVIVLTHYANKNKRIRFGKELSLDDYSFIDKSKYWSDSPEYDNYFPKLKKLILGLPFDSIGRNVMVFNKGLSKGIIHYDVCGKLCKCRVGGKGGVKRNWENWRQEFIWLRLNKNKKLFVGMDEKYTFLKGNSCWFNTRFPYYHGAESSMKYTASVRIDGKFTREFREKLFGEGSTWETIKI
jgi:hypothetical protein